MLCLPENVASSALSASGVSGPKPLEKGPPKARDAKQGSDSRDPPDGPGSTSATGHSARGEPPRCAVGTAPAKKKLEAPLRSDSPACGKTAALFGDDLRPLPLSTLSTLRPLFDYSIHQSIPQKPPLEGAEGHLFPRDPSTFSEGDWRVMQVWRVQIPSEEVPPQKVFGSQGYYRFIGCTKSRPSSPSTRPSPKAQLGLSCWPMARACAWLLPGMWDTCSVKVHPANQFPWACSRTHGEF